MWAVIASTDSRDNLAIPRAVLVLALLLAWTELGIAEESFAGLWKRNGLATPVFEINGTEGRNNPIRRQLEQPLVADEVYVRYRLRYEKQGVDTPAEDEGEFFVLWP